MSRRKTHDDNYDDGFGDRQHAISVLEGDAEPDVDESVVPHDVDESAVDDPLVGDEAEGHYDKDEIDQADDITRAIPHADQLTHKAMLRKNTWKGLHAIAPFSRIQPPSVLHGTLGGQQQVYPGQKIQVANWAGPDAETTPVTITLAPLPFIPPSVTASTVPPRFRNFGIVQFGTRAFSTRIEVDIGQGCQFTVGASAVTLQVATVAAPVFGPLPLDPAAFTLLGGMLSFLPIVRTTPITRTLYIDELPGGGTVSVTLKVPYFAKTLTVWKTFAGSFDVYMFDNQGHLSFQGSFFAGGGPLLAYGESIVIPGDVEFISLKNSGALPSDFRLVFGLSL